MSTPLTIRTGDRIASNYYGFRVEGTVRAIRAHSIRWDVRELTIEFDHPTLIITPSWADRTPRNRVLIHDDWFGNAAEGFSAASGPDIIEVLP